VVDDDERATSAGYDLWAPLYDDGDPSTWLDEPFLLEQLNPFPGCRILDLGCGTGRYLRRLSSNLYRVVAVDLSRGMLARAGRAMGDRQDIHFLQASVTCLPFHPGQFDRIMSGLVIDHVPTPEDLFRQMAELLAPKGRAIVAGVHPEMQRLTGADIEVAGDQGAVSIHGRIHEVAELIEAARRARFVVEALHEPCVTPGMVARRPAWRRRLGCPALVLLALVT
jgi:ubiquinone/menaquinone biosynthesis C-methylase UbiE